MRAIVTPLLLATCLALLPMPAPAAPGPRLCALASAAQTVASEVLGCRPAWDHAWWATDSHRARTVNVRAGERVVAAVDAETGLLVQLRVSRPGKPLRGDPKLTAAEALARARGFLERVPIRLEAPWRLVSARYLARREYAFEWVKVVCGFWLPASLKVAVDADTGELRSYSLIDDPVVVPLQPCIPVAQAVAILARYWKVTDPVVEETRAVVDYHPHWPGPQMLFWEITLRDSNARRPYKCAHFSGRVNAHTGVLALVWVLPVAAGTGKGKVAARLRALVPPCPKPNSKAVAQARIPPTVFQLVKSGPWPGSVRSAKGP